MEQVNDHDLLIKIDTKLERVILDVQELKDNVASRVTTLEQEKADRQDAESMAKDIQALKTFRVQVKTVGTIGLLILGILQFIVNKFF